MRNSFFAGEPASAIAARLAGAEFTRGQIQNLGTIILVIALMIAGPVALSELMQMRPASVVIGMCVAGAVAIAAHLQRCGEIEMALVGQQAALAFWAAGLSVAPGYIDAAVTISVASLVYGVTISREAKLSKFALPVAGLAASFAIDLTGLAHGAGGAALFAYIASIAACVMAGVGIAVLVKSASTPQSASFYSDTVEGLTGAIVSFNPEGHVVHASRTATQLLGARAFEVTGTGLFDRIHLLDRPQYARAMSDMARGAPQMTLELRMRTDGAPSSTPVYKWIEIALAGLNEATVGEKRSVVAVMRDISARKFVEDELRTARAQAEEASEAKTRFLATIGHELRTPLNAIVGFSDMMAEGIGGKLTPTHQEYAGHIRQSGHHLLEVVNMLLDMSKIDAGKFEIQAEPFSPRALVDPCMQMVETLARERAVELSTQIPDHLPQLVGDERACRQIIINLLSNAIKFSHDGGRVTFSIKRHGKMLALAVSDDGIGMPEETVLRIGEPFLQAQNGLSRRYEGTGLGLSIVKGLIALHDGRLSVASEPGIGTKVTVMLPIDGPTSAAPRPAPVEHLDERRRETDEAKWQEDEKRSATS